MSTAVPVEHRLVGLDRRTVKPTLIVALIVVLYSVGAPFLDGLVDHDSAVEPGTTVEIGSGVTLVPPAAWEITDRTALDAGSLELHNSGVIVNVVVGPYTGELDGLLEFAAEDIDTDLIHHEASSIVSADGAAGLEEHFDGLNTEGLVAVYADGTTGVSIAVEGPEPMVTRYLDDIDEMIASVRFGAES